MMFRKLVLLSLLPAAVVMAQPGQPAPLQPSAMRNPDSKPSLLPSALKGVDISQNLDQQVPLNLMFRDEYGRAVPLSTYFSGNKPVLLALVYYNCPMLCPMILSGVTSALKVVSLNPGRDFEVVTVSFDPRDTPQTALQKKLMYLKSYNRPDTANGWHFLTGSEASIKALTQAVGFKYKYDPSTGQFAHASAIMILTPQGKLSRYFYGVEYAPQDVRLGLVDASHEKIGNPVDKILLFCCRYDPLTGKYTAVAMNVIRLAGLIFVLIAGTFLLLAWRHERAKHSHSVRQAA